MVSCASGQGARAHRRRSSPAWSSTLWVRDAKGTVAVRGEVNMLAMPLRYRAQVDIGHLDLTAFLNKPAWASDLNLQAHIEGEGVAPRELESARPRRHSPVTPGEHQSYNRHRSTCRHDRNASRCSASRSRRRWRACMRRERLTCQGGRICSTSLAPTSAACDSSWTRHASMGTCICRDRRPASGLHLTVRGALDVREVQYREYALDTLRLTYEAADLGTQPHATTQLRLQRARLGTVPVAQVELQGTYDGATRQVQFTVNVDQAPGNGMNTQGKLTLQEMGQRVDIETLRLQLAERVWQAAAPLQVIHEADRLQFTPLRLVHAEESIEISGGIAGEQLQDIRVQASQIDLAIVQHLMTLPDPVRGRATLQVLLSGTLPAPLLQVDLSLQPEGRQDLPFQRIRTSLAYAQQLLQGQVRIQQADREVLAVDLHLPVDLALTAIPLDQRLVEGPIALDVHLRQPDLAAFARWYRGCRSSPGPCKGRSGCRGPRRSLASRLTSASRNLASRVLPSRWRGRSA